MFDKSTSFVDKKELYITACIAYNEGNPIMTDAEFDLLEKELAGSDVVDLTHDEHAGATIDSDTFSIRPIHDENVVLSWMGAQSTDEFMASLKIDGVLVKLQTGKQFAAESRGRNDRIPWDYTKTMSLIVPDITDQYFIRGEAFLPKEHLEYFRDKYDDSKYKVSKSAAITILRRPQDHTIEDIRKLKFMPYYIEGSYETRLAMFEKLRDLGFDVPPFRIIASPVLSEDLGDLTSIMESTTHPSDGIVIEYNDLTHTAIPDGKYLSTQIAAKLGSWGNTYFRSEVTGVKLSPGKGHYGVVLTIKPVVHPDGITYSNINAFNIGMILRNNIGVGTEIIFERQSNGLCYLKGVV